MTGAGLCLAALVYAEKGWAVFPCHTVTDGRCSCGKPDCDSPGKHPRTEHGFKDATPDREVIEAWWERWPDSNIAVATGKVSGIVVLDLDRHGEADGVKAIKANYELPADTPCQLTGGGGLHYFFKCPEGGFPCKMGILPGVEVKGDGGYVILHPSLHLSGRRYEWKLEPSKVPLLPVPNWVADLCTRPLALGGQGAVNGLIGELLVGVDEGNRNKAAAVLVGHWLAKGLKPEDIWPLLKTWNRGNNPPLEESELAKTFKSIVDRHQARVHEVTGILAELTTDPVELEAGLREIAALVKNADTTRREIVRGAVIARLKELNLERPARLVDAVLRDGAPAKATGQGQPISWDDPEPWPESVNVAKLLDQLVGIITRYVVLPRHIPEAAALWVVLTWCLDAFDVAPYLAVTSPLLRCGKTTLLTLLGLLVRRPLFAAHATSAAVFRVLERARPCLLLDELDTYLKDDHEMRGILNAGHLRGGCVIRCVAVGDDFEERAFGVFGVKGFAKIGALNSTLADRSIVVEMRRKKRGERVERLRSRETKEELEPVRRMLARFAEDNLEALKIARPAVPAALNDRQADNWEPLLAIADLAGPTWSERARAAALALSGGEGDQDAAGTLLLADIKSCFDDSAPADPKDAGKLPTVTLLERLHKLTERSWATWSRGKPITANGLANVLKPYGVRPRDLWLEGRNVRGYEMANFEDAWERYLHTDMAAGGTPGSEVPRSQEIQGF